MTGTRSARLILTWLTLAIAWTCAACASDEASVRFDLRTDFVPGLEFDAVRVYVNGMGAVPDVSHIVTLSADYPRGVRLGSISGAARRSAHPYPAFTRWRGVSHA